MSGSNGYDIQ